MRIAVLFLLFTVFSCAKKNSLHEKFPEVLLTDDFGILTEKDLFDKAYTYPIGKLDTHPSPAPRWFCFDTEASKLNVKCISSGDKIEGTDEYLSDLEMSVESSGKRIKYDFGFSTISYYACEEHRLAWEKIIKDERSFCVAARLMEVDSKDSNRISGTFHMFKTKKGCDSLFLDDCKN